MCKSDIRIVDDWLGFNMFQPTCLILCPYSPKCCEVEKGVGIEQIYPSLGASIKATARWQHFWGVIASNKTCRPPIIYWLVVWNMTFIFPYIGDNHPKWLIFFRGVETTNQYITGFSLYTTNRWEKYGKVKESNRSLDLPEVPDRWFHQRCEK